MNIKHIAAFSVVASLVTITASAQQAVAINKNGIGFNWRMPVESKVVKGAPFSAEIVTESIQTLADGNRIVQRSSSRVYRDSEGRVRREEDRDAGGPAISITDPVAGASFMLDTQNRVASRTSNMAGYQVTLAFEKAKVLMAHELEGIQRKLEDARKGLDALPPNVAAVRKAEEQKIARAAAVSDHGREQARVEQLPERIIEGVRAQGVRRTTTIAAGAIGNELPIEIVSEEWTSPDLKIFVFTERRDPRMGTSTYRVANINRAEPDHYLFEVPSDYTVNQTGVIRKLLPGGRGSVR
jgi:hypothetical protein